MLTPPCALMCSLLPQRPQAARSSPAPLPRSPAVRNWAELSSPALLASPWLCPGPAWGCQGPQQVPGQTQDWREGLGAAGQPLAKSRTQGETSPKSSSSSFSPSPPYTVTNNSCHSLGAHCLPYTGRMYVPYLLHPKSVLNNEYYYPHLSGRQWRFREVICLVQRHFTGQRRSQGSHTDLSLPLAPCADRGTAVLSLGSGDLCYTHASHVRMGCGMARSVLFS